MNALRCVVSVAAAWVVTRALRVLLSLPRDEGTLGQEVALGSRTPVKIADRVLNRILSMLPDTVAIAVHANRRAAIRDDRDGFVFVHCNPTPHIHYARLAYNPYEHAYNCRWVSSTGTDVHSFDHKGRFMRTGHREPFTDKVRHCGRFSLQRMCRRLVQRTRCRIKCRIHLQPYLIPDLVNIVTAYC